LPSTIKKGPKGWRYQFQHEGKTYSKAWFPTKAAAIAAREEHKKKIKAGKRVGEGLTFRELANEYLDHSERRHAPKTYQYKVIVYRKFKEWAGEGLPADQVTVQFLESFLRTRPGNISYNRYRKDLCALLAWAWKRRLIAENPCFFLEKMPEPRYVRVIPSKEEMSRIMLAAGADRPFLLVMYHTLARLDEVLRLRWNDVNFAERIVKLWTRKRRGGGWEYDLFPMNEALYKTLRRLWQTRSQDEWVFYNRLTKTRYNKRPKLMRSICKRAGVPYYGFHAIRHFAASRLHDTYKFSLPKISRLLRHTSKQTTERYLQTIDQDLRQVMESLSGDF
jgi:integrase